MHLAIIANGFQEDYMEQMLTHMAPLADRIDFIGSSIHRDRTVPGNVVFYNLRGGHEEQVPVVSKITRILRYHLKLVTYLLWSRATIVHVQYVRFPVAEGILLTLFIRLLGKKAVYTAHDVLPHSRDTRINRIVYGWIYRLQNQIIAHTNYIRQRIAGEFGIPERKIHVVPHGVYERSFDTALTPAIARKQLQLEEDRLILLFFGFIAEYKGLDLLLGSMKQVHGKRKLHLVIAGRVAPEYRNEFSRLVEDPSVKGMLTLHIRFIRDEEIETLFKAAHVAVLPYREASQSGVLFMSYAYGVPVLVPNLGGFPDDVIPEKTGFVFEKENPSDLTLCLEQISSTESVITGSCSQFIRDHAFTQYAWSRSCSMMADVYRLK
jgi:glycosyltransferase involved in cell wall biosynthesis